MGKVYFEDNEEFKKFMKRIIPAMAIALYENTICESLIESTLRNAKEDGYIKKSIVEEVEDVYKEWSSVTINGVESDITLKLIHTMYSAIQRLNHKPSEASK